MTGFLVWFDEGDALVARALLDGELEGFEPNVLQVLGVPLRSILLEYCLSIIQTINNQSI